MNLIEFLLARIAEDEAVAERCIQRNRHGDVVGWHAYRHHLDTATLPQGAVAVPAPGFLAECQAKRRVIALFADAAGKNDCDFDELWFADTLHYLAEPYADHPEYRAEWRP